MQAASNRGTLRSRRPLCTYLQCRDQRVSISKIKRGPHSAAQSHVFVRWREPKIDHRYHLPNSQWNAADFMISLFIITVVKKLITLNSFWLDCSDVTMEGMLCVELSVVPVYWAIAFVIQRCQRAGLWCRCWDRLAWISANFWSLGSVIPANPYSFFVSVLRIFVICMYECACQGCCQF